MSEKAASTDSVEIPASINFEHAHQKAATQNQHHTEASESAANLELSKATPAAVEKLPLGDAELIVIATSSSSSVASADYEKHNEHPVGGCPPQQRSARSVEHHQDGNNEVESESASLLDQSLLRVVLESKEEKEEDEKDEETMKGSVATSDTAASSSSSIFMDESLGKLWNQVVVETKTTIIKEKEPIVPTEQRIREVKNGDAALQQRIHQEQQQQARAAGEDKEEEDWLSSILLPKPDNTPTNKYAAVETTGSSRNATALLKTENKSSNETALVVNPQQQQQLQNTEDFVAAFQAAFYHYARVLDPELAALDERLERQHQASSSSASLPLGESAAAITTSGDPSSNNSNSLNTNTSKMEDVAVALAATLLKNLRQLDPELAAQDEAAGGGELVQYDRVKSMQEWLRDAVKQASASTERSLLLAQQSAQESMTGVAISCQQAAIELVRLLDPEMDAVAVNESTNEQSLSSSSPRQSPSLHTQTNEQQQHQETENTSDQESIGDWLKRILAQAQSDSAAVMETMKEDLESVKNYAMGCSRQFDPELAAEDEKRAASASTSNTQY